MPTSACATAQALPPLDLVWEKASTFPRTLGPTPDQIRQQRGYDMAVSFLRAVVYEDYNQAIRNEDVARVAKLAEIYPEYANRTRFGLAPLHLAARAGNRDMVEVLVRAGADIAMAAETIDGYTPLHEAAAQGRVDVVGWLLAQGAPRNARSADGRTSIQIAKSLGRDNVVRYFEQH